MFKGVSQCVPAVSMDKLYFVHSTSSTALPYPFSPTPIIQQLSVHILMSSACTDVIFYDIVDALSFSFPFTPSSSYLGVNSMREKVFTMKTIQTMMIQIELHINK
jgi:hypothetical protein